MRSDDLQFPLPPRFPLCLLPLQSEQFGRVRIHLHEVKRQELPAADDAFAR